MELQVQIVKTPPMFGGVEILKRYFVQGIEA